MTVRSSNVKDVNGIYTLLPVKTVETKHVVQKDTNIKPNRVINLGITDFVNSLPNTPITVYLGGLLPSAVPVMLTVGVVTCVICIAVATGMGIDPNHIPVASPFRFYMQFGGKAPMGIPPA